MSGVDNKYTVSCLLLSPSQIRRYCECLSRLPLAPNMGYPQHRLHRKGIKTTLSEYLSPLPGPLSHLSLELLISHRETSCGTTSSFFPPILAAPRGVRREAGGRVVPSGPPSAAAAAALRPAGAKLLDAKPGEWRNWCLATIFINRQPGFFGVFLKM